MTTVKACSTKPEYSLLKIFILDEFDLQFPSFPRTLPCRLCPAPVLGLPTDSPPRIWSFSRRLPQKLSKSGRMESSKGTNSSGKGMESCGKARAALKNRDFRSSKCKKSSSFSFAGRGGRYVRARKTVLHVMGRPHLPMDAHCHGEAPENLVQSQNLWDSNSLDE